MKVFLRTYGCRANQYDTEAVRALLASNGAEEADSPLDADFAIFNSCTVTAAAEADLRAGVRAAARANPRIATVVMGCAAGVPKRDEGVAPLATLPNVEAVVPGADVDAIAVALGLTVNLAPGQVQSGARALLRIQDGCDEHCTFCATTIARGSNRSRPAQQILDEAASLAATHPEIVLTGIHIGTYGRDIGSSLGELVEALIAEVPLARFRLSSVEATEVDARLADLLRRDSLRLAPHIHAPLQSGSDAVLRRMGRNWYNAASYEAAVHRLTEGQPVFGLSADVITGFPGESDDDHRSTIAMVERMPFTSLHVFPYSPRPGTAALRLGAHVPESVSRRRANELRALGAEKAARYSAQRVGGISDVVVTERGKGLTEDYLSVSVSDSSIPRRSRFHAVLYEDRGQLTAIPA